MSYYEGLLFFGLLVIVLSGGVLLGVMEKSLRYYTLAVSLLFLLGVFGHDLRALCYLTAFYLISTGLVFWYFKERQKHGRKESVYHVVLVLSLLPLVLCKISAVFDKNIFGFVGISYLTFRVVQVIIEIYDGVIKEVSFLEFTSFLLFFPSLSSGPIDRSRRFHKDYERVLSRESYLALCTEGIWKLLLGAVYKIVIASFAYKLMGYLETGFSWYLLIGYAYAYGIYLFFDFAGYSLMAVGSANIMGVELPDNFRMPFISTDIRDFWDRWHISLSHWFRDYVFTRFVMYSTRKKWFHTRLNRACAGFIVNMGIMGIWHGITPAYLVYGFYHGLLLAATEIYQKKSGFYKKNKKKQWYQVLSWAVTMQLVMFGFLIFSGRILPA